MNETSIKTQRLLLRQWNDSDLPSLTAMNQNPKVMEFIGPVIGEAESRAMMERARSSWRERGYGRFAVELTDTSELIGFVGLAQCKFESHFTPAVEMGWRLVPEHWGLGYATEAATSVMEWAFSVVGINEVVSFCSALNLGSRGVMEKLGMNRNTLDDFEHPNLEPGDSLRECVLYRKPLTR